MTRKDLLKSIAVATGLSLAAGTAIHADPGNGNPQGYASSGNSKAAGGPDNPGVGNPFGAY
ncbi:MAG: hypothetical protein ACU0DK_13360 [Pseudooceanicola sp.]